MLSLFVLIFSHIGVSAQVLSLTPHPLQNYQHPFNEEFIKRNDIQSIQVEISCKKEMDIIRPANRFLVFEFNEEGGLVSEKKFKIGETDTLNFAFSIPMTGNYFRNRNISEVVSWKKNIDTMKTEINPESSIER